MLSSLTLITTVRAASYEIGVEEDDALIWILNSLDDSSMEDLFGKNWNDDNLWENAEKDTKMRIEITSIDTETQYGYDWFEIKADMWYWKTVSNDKWGDEDEKIAIWSLEDPGEYEDLYGKENSVPGENAWIYPTPIGDYFDEVSWADKVNVNGMKLTVDYEADDIVLGGVSEEDCTFKATYNDKGVVQNAQLLDKDDNVIAEFTLDSGIPGYEIPILLGITGLFTLGLVFLISRKLR